METAGLKHGPASADQPDLRWCLCLRPNHQRGERAGRAQASRPRLSPGAERLGGVAPRSPRAVHLVRGIREESASDRRQCQQQGADCIVGSVRRGDALLAGLLRCRHCGRRLHVSYSGTAGYCVRYHCSGAHLNHGTERCIAFGGLRVDAAVSADLLRVLAPLGIEAALHAIDARAADNSEAHRQAELALTPHYEAGLARRQYDAVNPDNRLVASELERRWNDRLVEVHRIEEQLAALATTKVAMPTAEERTRLMALGADVEALWHHPGASAETRKHISCGRRSSRSWPRSSATRSISWFIGRVGIISN